MRRTFMIAPALAIMLAFPLTRAAVMEALLFQPVPGVHSTPEALGIDASDVWMQTEDDVRIHGFFLPGSGSPTRAILFLHGNAGNASTRLPNAHELARLGSDVLLLDYRGYGRSEGEPTEEGLYADARAGLDHLVRVRGVPASRVVLFGRSLGGAVAVDLARGRELGGLILESTFTSLADVGAHLFGPFGRWFAGDGFDSLRKIDELEAPLLYFHGDRDQLVPYELGRELFLAAPEPRAFETLNGAGHNDIGDRTYFESIGRFLDEVAPLAPSEG